MANRRDFVRRLAGAGLVLPAGHQLIQPTPQPHLSTYQQILNKTPLMDLLGRPRSWTLVERELHPFAPERMIIVPEKWHRNPYYYRSNQEARRQLDEYIDVGQAEKQVQWSEHAAACAIQCNCPKWRPPGYPPVECFYKEAYDPERWFPQVKRESIFYIADTLSSHYRVPHLVGWAKGLAGRELLASTGIGLNFALAHQYQSGAPGPIPVQCPPIDWWMFLYPAGTNWAALDDLPVHAILTVVFQNSLYEPNEIAIWCLASQLAKTIVDDGFKQLSQMNRVEACRVLNHAMAQCIAGF